MNPSFSRRKFVATTAASGVFQIVPRHVPGGKLNIAGIGLGRMGNTNMLACAGENIVALFDVDHAFAAKTFKAFPNAKVHKDYHLMFEKQKDIDAVLIATPDHTHAVISMAAKETGVVTQMGIQGHSAEGLRLICEWIRAGAIGPVSEVDAWCALSYAPHGHAWWSSPLSDCPARGMPTPKDHDRDLWPGPAAQRPYHTCYHPAVWRCWWDFGCGMIGDRGAHTLNPVFSALKLTAPESIEGSGITGGNSEVHPDKARVTYHFPAREGFPPLKLNWNEGREPPRPPELEEGRRLPDGGGVLFKGAKGIIMCGVYGDSPRLIPESALKACQRPEKTLPRIKGGHEQNWIDAIKSGGKASADFDYSGPLTELALSGNIAKKFPDRKLLWHNEQMKVTNLDEANEWVRRPYREGWSL